MYIAVVEIENASSKDFEDVDLKIYTSNDTLLLNERTRIIDSPNIVLWSPDFSARLQSPVGGVLTQEQWKIYNHQRVRWPRLVGQPTYRLPASANPPCWARNSRSRWWPSAPSWPWPALCLTGCGGRSRTGMGQRLRGGFRFQTETLPYQR